jgi:predicted acetyltransferase
MAITLRELTPQDEAAFLKGANEWALEELTWYSFEWKPGVPYGDMLRKLEDNKAGKNLPSHFVPSTMLYAFDDRNEIVGRLNIRHSLNENLTQRGGHIGYAVAEKYRGKGYAKEILKQGLSYCKTLELQDLLLTCADTNIPSWKVIEHFGGRLENKIFDSESKETVRRYWLKLDK